MRVSIPRFILFINELLLPFCNTNDVKIVKHFLICYNNWYLVCTLNVHNVYVNSFQSLHDLLKVSPVLIQLQNRVGRPVDPIFNSSDKCKIVNSVC